MDALKERFLRKYRRSSSPPSHFTYGVLDPFFFTGRSPEGCPYPANEEEVEAAAEYWGKSQDCGRPYRHIVKAALGDTSRRSDFIRKGLARGNGAVVVQLWFKSTRKGSHAREALLIDKIGREKLGNAVCGHRKVYKHFTPEEGRLLASWFLQEICDELRRTNHFPLFPEQCATLRKRRKNTFCEEVPGA